MDVITKHRQIVFKKVTKKSGEIKAVFLKFLIPVCAQILQSAPAGAC